MNQPNPLLIAHLDAYAARDELAAFSDRVAAAVRDASEALKLDPPRVQYAIERIEDLIA